MSSTARGGERHISDYYQTPQYVIKDLIEFLITSTKILENYPSILDPCAGGSINKPMAYVEALKSYELEVDSIDIREDSLADIKSDFLEVNLDKEYDVVLSNPPFALALDFINKSLAIVKSGGYVIMLLRLNFFESIKRKEFFDEYMPIYSVVHHKRISFTPDGKTDSICYMHAIWQKDNYTEFTKLKVI